MNEGEQQIELPILNKALITLKLKDIVYFESSNKMSIAYYIENGSLTKKYVNLMIGELEHKLLKSSFFRSHKSFFINLAHVLPYDEYPKDFISMSVGSTILLSRRKKLAFHIAFKNYTNR